MREIKFRAITRFSGTIGSEQMIYGSFLQISQNGDYRTVRLNGLTCQEDTLGQYTGLKDKDGKEIYEGDILEYKWYSAFKKWWSTVSQIPEIERRFEEQKNNPYTSCNVVEYQNGAFKVSNSGLYLNELSFDLSKTKWEKGMTGGDRECKWWDFKVVGNIHENPELLQKQNV